ncbi:CheR family methyltransferase [Sphingomonas echinoides]|uniref:CheR family methyltransferase n=1 Tax=Sphingomonas echinoides TaxID=59803 RepID=UPI003D68AFEF
MSLAPPPLKPSASTIDQISLRDFASLADYIFDYAGIRMPVSKKTMLEGRLRRRQRALGFDTLDAYCRHVLTGNTLGEEGRHLINAVTTNKTDFFREPVHFDFLRDVALPTFEADYLRTIRAWSVACSTGPEPYTMAMLLDGFTSPRRGFTYSILATDLDTEVLETARLGIYPSDLADPIPAALRRKYLMESRDPARREVRVVPELRRAIAFARLNLMDEKYPVGEPMHLIFCRNVLIYFDKQTQHDVVSKLVRNLAPDGYLFLGHSESIAGLDVPLVPVANTVFKRS